MAVAKEKTPLPAAPQLSTSSLTLAWQKGITLGWKYSNFSLMVAKQEMGQNITAVPEEL